jgi:serine-aspartate repeat-containing protein C/D/E
VPQLRDGKLTPDDTPLAGVTLQLVDGVTGKPILGSAALSGSYPLDEPVTVKTDAQGYYEFRGLAPGVYGIIAISPSGYVPGIDTAGSAGGEVISRWSQVDEALLDDLQVVIPSDAILRIQLSAGDSATDNNFSLVKVAPQSVQVFVFPQLPAAATVTGPGFIPPVTLPLENVFATSPLVLPTGNRRTGGSLYTWHLSVVDAGMPRAAGSEANVMHLTYARPADEARSDEADLDEGEWILGDIAGAKRTRKHFGLRGGTPISGDFNGDGRFEIGIFKDGQWFIDLNDNGAWDAGDLWARLGSKGDLPVAGDWDGDGKTDIGIYGPAWERDPRAIRHEPGLPDAHNENSGEHKNIPRPRERNAFGKRTLKLASTEKPRQDMIDHVFLYGTPGDRPVVGDWNGDGIHTIAVFRDGRWHRDTDGDGVWGKGDRADRFGQKGDLPVVGDFNGDGIDELGIFRDGVWYIDTNGNGVIDGEDRVFRLGDKGDKPVVGDWDGDGKSDPGVYREAG